MKKKLEFRVDAETHQALVARARQHRTSISALVRQAIRDGLARDGVSVPPSRG
jgi:predicted HicB family RNase H-like nuclease